MRRFWFYDRHRPMLRTGARALIVLLLLCLPAHALDPHRPLTQLQHTAWNETSGLSGYVYALAQTDDGFLWVGTQVGLFRFDGIAFEQYHLPSEYVAISEVRTLLPTADGGLWVGYRTGAAFIKGGKAEVYTEQQGLPYGRVRSLVRTKDGSIWAAVVGGFSRFHDGKWQKIRTDWQYPEKSAGMLFVDRQDTLWVATGTRILYLPSGDKAFRDAGLALTLVPSIHQGPDGTLWFSDVFHDKLLPLKSPLERNSTTVPTVPIGAWSFLFDRDGSLWIAADDVHRLTAEVMSHPEQVLAASEKTTDAFRSKDGLSDALATATLEDREGNIWIGTSTGLDRFRNRSAMQVDLDANRHFLIPGLAGDVWIGPTYMDDSFIRIQDRKPLVALHRPIATASMDPDGTFWFGTAKYPPNFEETLWKFQAGKLTKVPGPDGIPNPYIKNILVDDTGTHWFAMSGHGEYTWKDGIWKFIEVFQGKDADLSPDQQFLDSQGRAWLTYYARLCVAMIDHGHPVFFNAANGLDVGAPITGAAHGSQIWVAGTNALGLFDGKRFSNVHGVDGNAFANVQVILPTEKNGLWLKTATGLILIAQSEIDKVERGDGLSVQYRVFDGTTDFTNQLATGTEAIKSSDGKLWFLSKGGIAVIDPSHLFHNDLAPPVVIRSLTAEGVVYPLTGAVTLPVDTENLSIDYTALSLTLPERNQFRYQLIGFDKGWQDAKGRRQAFYTNLPPGKYTFRVIASNNDGVWNMTGASASFTIPPTFIQTIWFRILCVLAFGLVLVFCFLWRLRQIESKAKLRLSERLVERERIARELHDTLLQGFQGLVLRFQAAAMTIPKEEAARDMMETALNRADDILAEGRNRVRDLRVDEPASLTLAERLLATGDEWAIDQQARFTLLTHGHVQELHRIVCEEAYWIAREAVINAFLHSGGEAVTIELAFSKDHFLLRVKDDGVGIDADTIRMGKAGHFGLSGMQERAARIGAVLHIHSPKAGGTRVELTIPARIAYVHEERRSVFNSIKRLFVRRR